MSPPRITPKCSGERRTCRRMTTFFSGNWKTECARKRLCILSTIFYISQYLNRRIPLSIYEGSVNSWCNILGHTYNRERKRMYYHQPRNSYYRFPTNKLTTSSLNKTIRTISFWQCTYWHIATQNEPDWNSCWPN